MKKSAIVLGCSLIAMVSHASPITTHYDNTCVFKNPLILPTMEFKCLNDNLIELNHNYEYYTLINQDGKIIIPKYQQLSDTSGGNFDIIIDNKERRLDAFGNMIIPAHYDHIGYSKTDDFYAHNKGIIDTTGKVLFEPKYHIEAISNASENDKYFAIASQDDKKYGILDISGKIILPIRYDSISISNTKTALLHLDNQKISIDRNGKIVEQID